MPFIGTLTLRKNYHRAIEGDLTFSGALQNSTAFKRALDGVITFSGNLTTAVSSINLYGILSNWLGVLTMKKNGIPVGGKIINIVLGKIKGLFISKDIEL